MKKEQIDDLLKQLKTNPSKWELDNIIYHDRTSNPKTLFSFLSRIKQLETEAKSSTLTARESQELEDLLDLLDDIDETDIEDLTDRTDEEARDQFIEELARISAIQVLTDGKMDFDTMTTTCKLSPNDFILCAKRTQDLINTIRGLVIKGETLSKDVAGA